MPQQDRGKPRGTPARSTPAKSPAPRARSKAVFWRRRLLALGVVGLIVVGLVWGAGRLLGILGDALETAVAEQRTEPSGISTAQPVACPPDSLEWQLAHDAGVAGSPVRFQLTVTNRSAEACLVDAGAQTLVLEVVSGEDDIWSNAHCGSAEPVWLLLGPEDDTARAVTWDGSRSSAGCTAVAAPVRSGTYQVGLTYASVAVPGSATVFALR